MDIEHYNGPQNPVMSKQCVHHNVHLLTILAAKIIVLNRALAAYYEFLCYITQVEDTPEYNSFNTQIVRSQGHAVISATKAIYTPLIDMKPGDPNTVINAMAEGQTLLF